MSLPAAENESRCQTAVAPWIDPNGDVQNLRTMASSPTTTGANASPVSVMNLVDLSEGKPRMVPATTAEESSQPRASFATLVEAAILSEVHGCDNNSNNKNNSDIITNQNDRPTNNNENNEKNNNDVFELEPPPKRARFTIVPLKSEPAPFLFAESSFRSASEDVQATPLPTAAAAVAAPAASLLVAEDSGSRAPAAANVVSLLDDDDDDDDDDDIVVWSDRKPAAKPRGGAVHPETIDLVASDDDTDNRDDDGMVVGTTTTSPLLSTVDNRKSPPVAAAASASAATTTTTTNVPQAAEDYTLGASFLFDDHNWTQGLHFEDESVGVSPGSELFSAGKDNLLDVFDLVLQEWNNSNTNSFQAAHQDGNNDHGTAAAPAAANETDEVVQAIPAYPIPPIPPTDLVATERETIDEHLREISMSFTPRELQEQREELRRLVNRHHHRRLILERRRERRRLGQLSRRNRNNVAPTVSVPPMRAGESKARQVLTFASHLDVVDSNLLAAERTDLLAATLCISKSAANSWRVHHERRRAQNKEAPVTVWKFVTDCARDLSCTAQSIMEERKLRSKKGNKSMEDKNRDKATTATTKTTNIPKGVVSFGQARSDFLRTNLIAFLGRESFKTRFEATIQPVPEGAESSSEDETMYCPICCDQYRKSSMASCNSQQQPHTFCLQCLRRYFTETMQVGELSCVSCADPSCEAVFSIDSVRACLSEWEQLRIQERQEEINRRVALAADNILCCECGSVALVEGCPSGSPPSTIQCPNAACHRSYCVACGYAAHEGNCGPPPETLAWIDKETKKCPNCHTPIEKNGGCDHMHCAPPGGCGHHFYFSTGKPYPR